VGEYRVQAVAGRGGMGVVYAAVQPVIEKKVAIKVLSAQLSSDRDLVRRFIDEARAVNKIGHENIIDIFSFGQLPDGRQYFVMEYLEGATLAERLERGDLSPAEVPQVLAQICDALDAAHATKIVHRDLKPENVWLGVTGRGRPRVRLLDFGIAKLLESGDRSVTTDVGVVMGTPHYMSPEQAAGELDIDGRSDLYSLGVLGYYMLSGALPFDGTSFETLAARHIAEGHTPLATIVSNIPPALDESIERCLVKRRDERWRNGRELADALSAGPEKKRWFHRATARPLFRARAMTELAMFAAAMKAVFKWTMI